MTDDADMLAAVLADPHDDNPRLVFADWCDDQGAPDRAEFIRVQIELAQWECIRAQSQDFTVFRRVVDRDMAPLKKREWELWHKLPTCYTFAPWAGSVSPDRKLTRFHFDTHLHSNVAPLAVVRRGFVDEIRLPMATFAGGACRTCGGVGVCEICDGTSQVEHPNGGVNHCPNSYDDDGNYTGPTGRCGPKCPDCGGTGHTPGIAADLSRRHPVTAVMLVDREPDDMGEGWSDAATRWGWWTPDIAVGYGLDQHDAVPRDIPLPWDRNGYAGYPTREAALAALSRACVAWGRSLAGLPPLSDRPPLARTLTAVAG